MRRKEQDNARHLMEPVWSVRMRASKRPAARRPQREAIPGGEVHVSGAEELCDFGAIESVVQAYVMRALRHAKGRPDTIFITIEAVTQKPVAVPVLPISTISCKSPKQALVIATKLLSDAGISKKAIQKGIAVVTGGAPMRGASMVRARTGRRADPDKVRGVRVSRMGLQKGFEKNLSRRLSQLGLNSGTVKEALILASKVTSCSDVMAELCVSDDPDYTTGYVAARGLGYVRIPNIKRSGSLCGGRVFFIKEGADSAGITEYLERRPVFVTGGPATGL